MRLFIDEYCGIYIYALNNSLEKNIAKLLNFRQLNSKKIVWFGHHLKIALSSTDGSLRIKINTSIHDSLNFSVNIFPRVCKFHNMMDNKKNRWSDVICD